jgi:hypothetical protein
MDPLSISMSILTVLQFTGIVINYLKDVKDASEDKRRLLDETVSIEAFLSLLKNRAEAPQDNEGWHKTFVSLIAPKGPLQQFKLALDRLALKLEPAEGLKRFRKEMVWPFQKQEIRDILAIIERQKALFILALQNDHLLVSPRIPILITIEHCLKPFTET